MRWLALAVALLLLLAAACVTTSGGTAGTLQPLRKGAWRLSPEHP